MDSTTQHWPALRSVDTELVVDLGFGASLHAATEEQAAQWWAIVLHGRDKWGALSAETRELETQRMLRVLHECNGSTSADATDAGGTR